MVVSSVAFLFAFVACLCSVSYLYSALKPKIGKNGSLGLPPGPFGLPLIGSLHLLGDSPHRSLQRLATKYGPIMFLRLGMAPTIVVSDHVSAELFLKTHDLVFASRPNLQVLDHMAYPQSKDFAFAPYGAYWRSMRKLCTLELFTSSKFESFKSLREEELAIFVKSINDATKSGAMINFSAKVGFLVEDMTYRMILGFKDDRFNMRSTMQEAVGLVGTFYLPDYIPYIGALDLQGLRGRMETIHKALDTFFEKLINEHITGTKKPQGHHKSFIDVLVSMMESNNLEGLQLDRINIKAVLFDLFGAAMDTSSTVITWVITELLKHPHVMKVVQEELENIVGLDRMVEETDLVKLDYLKMVIKEGMRLHTVAPLLFHACTEDITVKGYYIPKNSRVLINAYAIGRDPNAWSRNAEEFYPERFIGSKIDVQGHDFQLLPFGAGRRKCPGMQIGMTIVQLVVAQLVHCFNLKLPHGMSPDDIDMTEKFGLTLHKAKPLVAFPIFRLNSVPNLNAG